MAPKVIIVANSVADAIREGQYRMVEWGVASVTICKTRDSLFQATRTQREPVVYILPGVAWVDRGVEIKLRYERVRYEYVPQRQAAR